MMRRIAAALVAWVWLCALAHAQLMTTGVGQGDAGPGASGGGCSQATTYLSGKSYTVGQQTAITTFICNEVTNGNWAHLALFAAAFGGSANDVYNWVSNTTMTFNGTITRNSPGWTGGAGDYIDTGLVVGSTIGTQNSVSMGGCVVGSRTTGANTDLMGVVDTGAGATSRIQPLNTSVNQTYAITGNNQNTSGAVTNAQHSWAVQRTSSTAVAFFEDGTSIASASNTSIAPVAAHLYLMALDNGGASNNLTDTVGYFFAGDGSVNIANLYSDAHALWTSAGVGGAGGC